MARSPHVRDGIDNTVSLRFQTGLVGFAVLFYVAAHVLSYLLYLLDRGAGSTMDPLNLMLMVTTPVGWGGLVYACWIRSGRITDTALVFVLALGVVGMAVSLIVLTAGRPATVPFDRLPWGIVSHTGTWILNGLGVVWIVHTVRRIRAALNTEPADE